MERIVFATIPALMLCLLYVLSTIREAALTWTWFGGLLTSTLILQIAAIIAIFLSFFLSDFLEYRTNMFNTAEPSIIFGTVLTTITVCILNIIASPLPPITTAIVIGSLFISLTLIVQLIWAIALATIHRTAPRQQNPRPNHGN